MKRRNDRVEVTEHGAIYEVLPEVKDQFAPRHIAFRQKRRDCCHAVDAGSETRKCEAILFTGKGPKWVPSEYTHRFMTCPFDGDIRRLDHGDCPTSRGPAREPCRHFRRKL